MNDAIGIAALVVSVGSVGVAGWGIRHSKRSASAAQRSADAADRSALSADRSASVAEAEDRRARTPRFALLLDQPGSGDRMIYRVRNDGPQDLESVVVHRPRPPGGIEYHVAVTGKSTGWVDEADLGPIALGQEARFTLGCGFDPVLSEFRVRVECRAGNDEWTRLLVLPPPRGNATGRFTYIGGDV